MSSVRSRKRSQPMRMKQKEHEKKKAGRRNFEIMPLEKKEIKERRG
jgi:hypothetical protein